MNQGFGACYRINDSNRVSIIRSSGQRIKVYPFLIYRLKNLLGFPRLAIGITKKSGGSVVRNRFKRIIRECFRINKGSLGFYDYYFFSTCDLSKMSSEEVLDLQEQLIKRLSVYVA